MCRFILKSKNRECKFKGKDEYNGYCTRHKNDMPVTDPIPHWAMEMPEEKIPQWILDDVVQKKPIMRAVNCITPAEHFSILEMIYGKQQLKLLLKNSKLDNFTCTICFADDLKCGEIYVFEDCTHFYCLECLVHLLRVKIDDKNISKLICPSDGCNHEIIYDEVMCILSERLDLWYKYDNYENRK